MTEQTTAVVAAALTKEERIAKIDAQIVKLQAKRQSVIDGRPAKTKASVALPSIGDEISFNYGRGVTVTQLSGTVLGVKNEPGKPVVIRAQVGEGFDAEIVSLFPSQIIVPAVAAAAGVQNF
jgi:hypothetical protein